MNSEEIVRWLESVIDFKLSNKLKNQLQINIEGRIPKEKSIDQFNWDDLNSFKLIGCDTGNHIVTTNCPENKTRALFKAYSKKEELVSQMNFYEYLRENGYVAISGVLMEEEKNVLYL